MFEALEPLIKGGGQLCLGASLSILTFFLYQAQDDLVYVLKCSVLLGLPERHVPISQPWKVWGGFDCQHHIPALSPGD